MCKRNHPFPDLSNLMSHKLSILALGAKSAGNATITWHIDAWQFWICVLGLSHATYETV